MDRIGIFDYSFKRSPVFMGVCGNPSLLQINSIPLLRLEGKIGLENVLFRMKNYYISLRINRTEQRICINPHIHIIYSCEALVRATNFSICCRNSKSDLILQILFVRKYQNWKFSIQHYYQWSFIIHVLYHY